ncbi:XrtA/PEP-CTERM system TPR-repeat protein PrsT [Colwellia psychrerythraea]|uniref:PEP-CTERM system TPR-repeat lipoprotein n=1 Tax=Colwellia psychrerythraea TaxID=28229 RepID=A0A099KNR9_COLPS|nr:XrtA/PEP-CTERM system TPR-repeat protein PrsT [Colwellia psychrerythraea]KGJ91547.1 PEP-CTERM system TPR-repeat lipoprotein [Colwellia psychrerythraea]
MRLIFLFLLIFASFSVTAADDYEQALLAFEENNTKEAYIHLKNSLKHQPDNLPAKILMAKVLLKQELYSDGIDTFLDALDQGADINLVLNDLGHALMVTGQYHQVINLGKNRSLSKEGQLIWLLLSGNAYSSLNDNASARSAFEQALAINSNDIRALSAFASFELNQKNVNAAKKLIDNAVVLYPNDSRVWNLTGQYFDKISDQGNALTAYEKAHSHNANDPMVQRKLAHAYTNASQYDKALGIIEMILLATPSDPYAILLKSQLLAYSNKNEESQNILRDISEKLSRLTDEEKHSHISLAYIAGTAAYFQGEFELAQQELQFYIQERPEDLSGISILTDIYLQQGQTENALEFLEVKTSIIYADLRLSLLLVELYLNNKKLFKADGIISQLEITYKSHPQLIIARAKWLTISSRYDEALAQLDSNTPKDFDAAYALAKGLTYRSQGNLVKAVEMAELLLEKDSTNSDSLAFRGTLFLQQKQWQSAVDTFEKILINKPDDFSSLFNIATASAAMQNYQKSKEITAKLIVLQPNQVQLKILMAKLERDTGSIVTAIKLFKEIAQANKTNTEVIEALLMIYANQGDFNAALVESDKLTKLVFLNPAYIKQKAEIYLALNKIVDARKQLGLLQGVVNSPSELFQLSQLQLKLNDVSNAKNSIDKALSLAPQSLRLRLELVKIEMTLGNLDSAVTQLKTIEKDHKNNPNVLLVQGSLLMKQGKNLLAQKKFYAALSIDNHFRLALIKLYELTEQGIGGEEFSDLVANILKKYPNKHFMRNLLADYSLNNQDFHTAKLHYEKLAEVPNWPSKASVFNNLAYISINSDLGSAEAYAKKALALNDSSASIFDTYGWILSLRGNHNESLKILRKAFSMNSNAPSIRYHLGYTLNELGRTGEAKQELIKATSSTDTFIERNDAVNLLQQLSE